MSIQVSAKKLSALEVKRILDAQSIKLEWEKVCSNDILKVLKAHADAIGAPKEYTYFPLLTVIASFMGINASILINDEWSEPPILWNVIGARKGEKKSAAMKRLLHGVEVSTNACLPTTMNRNVLLLSSCIACCIIFIFPLVFPT